MGKLSAVKFYVRASLESLGVLESVHSPKASELSFGAFALEHSTVAVECGPRVDTDLAELALEQGVTIHLLEASPIFSRKLSSKLKRLGGSEGLAVVQNFGVSDTEGSLKYYFLNQSFEKNKGFPTLGIGKSISAVTLDWYFRDAEKPQFIKSDVEGLDLRVFAGAKGLIPSLDYFQLEMCSTDKDDYLSLFEGFELFVLLDEDHPLNKGVFEKPLVPIASLGWDSVFLSMSRGETNNLCGVRHGAERPSHLISQ